MKYPRISTSAPKLALVCASLIVLLYNSLFWTKLFAIAPLSEPRTFFFAFTVFTIFVGVMTILILLFGFKYLLRPFLIFIFLVSSVIAHFETTYGTLIDLPMIRNIVQTDLKESKELLTLSFAGHVLFLGVLPSAAIYFVRVEFKPFIKEAASRVLFLLAAVIVMAVIGFISYKELALIGRDHKELRLTLNPGYGIYSAMKFALGQNERNFVIQQIGLDSRLRKSGARKKNLIVLVVGETARAKEFSLNGYSRSTNPYLAKEGVISFARTYACGTSTAESLPCMFTHLDPSDYSPTRGGRYENILDVLSRAGVSVLWRDNNSGCKGVCARVAQENMSGLTVPGLCNGDECFDEILLHGLQDYVNRTQSDTLIVLHQKGSHGPAYYKRYPAAFARFSPECTSNSPEKCRTELIVNAYDNTIVYTDYFLHKTIELLKKNTGRFNTAMLYFSDHGESLGENGIYLHALPYSIAPDEQKRIPFILWLSDRYAADKGLNMQCLKQNIDRIYTHYNIFHSLLGAFDVSTDLYNREKDIFQSCQTGS